MFSPALDNLGDFQMSMLMYLPIYRIDILSGTDFVAIEQRRTALEV